MATHIIGKLGFNYRGNYNKTYTYDLQDLVSYEDNCIYVYTGLSPTSNINPKTTSHWTLYSESSNAISTTPGTLIYYDGSNLSGFSSGSPGDILTATSRQILRYKVDINGSVYRLTDLDTLTQTDQLRVELTDGDVVTFEIDNSIATNEPFIIGTDTNAGNELDSSHGVDYRVNGQSFPTHSAFIHRLDNVSVSTATVIWEVPTGFGASSNAMYYSSKNAGLGGQIGVVDYSTANNAIELKWRSYIHESPRKVMALPESKHSTTLNFAAFAMRDNSVRTVGDGSGYRHGNGAEDDTEYPSLVAFTNDFPGISSLKIAPYASLVYVIDTNNKLWIWGTSNVGEDGQSKTTYRVPEMVTGIPGDVLEIVDIHSANPNVPSSRDNNCTMLMVNNSGTIELWSSGYNRYGQLGHGTSGHAQVNTFTKVDTATNMSNPIVSVCGTGGNERTFFAIDSVGDVYSWGSNSYGGLGQGITSVGNVNSTPTLISYFQTNSISISKIRTSAFAVFAIATDNKLYVWGRNSYGILGLGSASLTIYEEPQYVADDVADVFTSPYDYEIVFLLMTDGTLRSAGDVTYGAQGQGIISGGSILTYTDITTENKIPISNVSKIVIGGTNGFSSSAMLKNDGTVMVSGYNGEGQLGLGDTETRTYFEQIKIKEYIKDIHWFGSGKDTILTLLTENDDVYICGSGTEGLNTQLRGNNYRVPTPLIF